MLFAKQQINIHTKSKLEPCTEHFCAKSWKRKKKKEKEKKKKKEKKRKLRQNKAKKLVFLVCTQTLVQGWKADFD